MEATSTFYPKDIGSNPMRTNGLATCHTRNAYYCTNGGNMLNVCLDVPVTTPSDIFIDLSILRSERIMSEPVDSSRETFFLGYIILFRNIKVDISLIVPWL